MDNDTLKKLQEVEYQILVDIDAYCRSNNIKYSLYAGTMLGAVRHGGFIPWDDDVDVAMTRTEYTKFCNCIQEKPMVGYHFYNYENDRNSINCHGKVRKERTLLLQEGEIETVGDHGIWVDIFPLDKIPLTERHSSETAKIGRDLVFLTRANGQRTNENVKRKIIRKFLKLIPGRFERMKRNAERLRELDKKITDNYEWASMSTLENIEKIRFPKEMLESYSALSFNGTDFMSFADYKGMLTLIYGDYMQLPPESKRVCGHTPAKIQF